MEIDAKFINALFFYLFSIVSVIFAFGVLFLPKIVYAIISMIIAFVSIACLFVLLNSDFLGLAQIMIYAIAVSILFLFAVMLVKDNAKFEIVSIFSAKKFVAAFSVVLFFICALFSFTNGFGIFDKIIKIFALQTDLVELQIQFQDIVCLKLLGINLLSNYVFAFELVSVLILVVMLGVAMFALKNVNCKIKPVEKESQKNDI